MEEITPKDADAAMQAGPVKSESRELNGHIVNPANDKLRIVVCDQPGAGGANHRYVIEGYDESGNPSRAVDQEQYPEFTEILFQNGPIAEDGNGINGITNEALLEILIDRMRGFQSGKYACDNNAAALNFLISAQDVLLSRTKERMARNVEGTHQV